MTSQIKTEHPCQKHTNVKPTSLAEWNFDLRVCEVVLTLAEDGQSVQNRGYCFYIPPTIRYLLSLQKPGPRLHKLVTLMKDLYLCRVLDQKCMWEGQLSNLNTEVNTVAALTIHIREIVQAGSANAAYVEEMVLSLTRGLIQDMDELQQPGLHLEPPSDDVILDARDVTAASDIYFLACILHPEIDIDEARAHWYRDLFHRQPIFIDTHKRNCRSGMPDAAARIPALTYLLHESMRSRDDDFVHVFEVFGRWALTVVDDLTATDEDIPSSIPSEVNDKKDGLGYEGGFVINTSNDSEFCLSPIPLHIRMAMTRICLRHTYRLMIEQADTIAKSSSGELRVDVFGHKMFRWILDCAMSSSLEPEYKNRVSTWMQSCGLDRVMTSDEPVGVMIPGQMVLSRLSVAWGPVDQPQTFTSFEDVAFEPCGPTLHPISYAKPVTDQSSTEGEVCNVCIEDMADGSRQVVKIDNCGHFVHHDCLSKLINEVQTWSNKCPACRQQICPPRAKKPLAYTESEEDDSGEYEEHDSGGYEEHVSNGNEEGEDENGNMEQNGASDGYEHEDAIAVLRLRWSQRLLRYLW